MTDKKKVTKIAFMDLDGTLWDANVTFEFVRHLFEKKILPDRLGVLFESALHEYRTGNLDKYAAGPKYYAWVGQQTRLWAEALKGIPKKTIEKEAAEFAEEFKPRIYNTSKELVDLLKSNKFHVVGISVGAIEPLKPLIKHLGINKVYGMRATVDDNNVYTGEIDSIIHHEFGKQLLINRVIRRERVRPEDCIGFGDTLHDSEMLSSVGTPIAVNPSHGLLERARDSHWTIAHHSDVVDVIKKKLSRGPRRNRIRVTHTPRPPPRKPRR